MNFVWGMLYYAESKKGAAHRDWLLKKMTRTGEQRDSTQREAAERMDALIVEVDDATEALKKADKEAEDYIEKGKELEAAMAANKKKIQETVAAAKQRKKELSEKAKMLEVTLREVAGGSKARLTCDTANKAIAAKSPSVAQPEKVAPRYVGALMRGPMGPPRGPAGQGWRPQPARTVEPATDKEVCEMEAKFPIPAYVKEGDRAALLAVTGIPGGILIR
ncbi:hypothetical protein H4R19_000908 [Coemansia spiralis]|nr:hypothetical protein H4R19_000908 [Coemansia spiralis]